MTGAIDMLGIRLPAPGWAVLDAVRTQGFTGELTLIGAPAVRLWADRGRIYHAEQIGAPPLAARLVASHVLSPGELARGVVRVGLHEHLGALFDRVPAADRHAVLLAVAAYTEEALRLIAGQHLAGAEVIPYAFDPDGVHSWNEPPANPLPGTPPTPPATPFAAPPTNAVPYPAPVTPSVPVEPAPPPAAPPPPPPTPAAPAATPAPEPAATAAATSPIDWDRLPYLERLASEREARGADSFSVIWPDGDVERRTAANGEHTPESAGNGALSIAGMPAGTRTRLLDERFGAL